MNPDQTLESLGVKPQLLIQLGLTAEQRQEVADDLAQYIERHKKRYGHRTGSK